jgi:hypothetical protein
MFGSNEHPFRSQRKQCTKIRHHPNPPKILTYPPKPPTPLHPHILHNNGRPKSPLQPQTPQSVPKKPLPKI